MLFRSNAGRQIAVVHPALDDRGPDRPNQPPQTPECARRRQTSAHMQSVNRDAQVPNPAAHAALVLEGNDSRFELLRQASCEHVIQGPLRPARGEAGNHVQDTPSHYSKKPCC